MEINEGSSVVGQVSVDVPAEPPPVIAGDSPGAQTYDLEVPSAAGLQAAEADKPWYESAGIDASFLNDKDKEYKTAEDYVKATHHARQLAASKFMIPGDDASVDEQAAFKTLLREHIGDEMAAVLPESAAAYELDVLKANEMLPDDRKSAIKDAFFDKKFTNEQASGALEIWNEQLKLDTDIFVAQIAETKKATHDELKQDWGPDYKDRLAGIDTVKGKYGDLMSQLDQLGVTARKDFMVMMDEVSRSTSEDSTVNPQGGAVNFDSQIAELKKNPKYKDGNAFERKAIADQLGDIYKRKAAAAR